MDYFDLGPFSRPITTPSPDAQVWFDRGLNWVYGYNHMEAVACFRKALEHDAQCAMASWGIAYASGPNYNLPWHLFDPVGRAQALAVAYDATQHALAVADGASAVEQALIRALPARYPAREPVDDMQPWNRAYTHAMRAVYEAYPDDLDVRTVFVEAIMNETPWRMWDLKTGEVAAGAGTVEAREVLASALQHLPATWDHPGLLHLYVHLMEMSPFPHLALRAGDRLRDLAPDAGHLIHMPTHIDVLCGQYRDVVVSNQKAIIADRKFLANNWLQVFKRAHTALLGSGGGPEQRTSLVPSEKCAVSWGSDDDERRMITASFVCAIERFAGDLCRHFLPLFQQVVAIRKTCNQLCDKLSEAVMGRRTTSGIVLLCQGRCCVAVV